jgi:rubrerythrin
VENILQTGDLRGGTIINLAQEGEAMQQFQSITTILDFAIGEEEAAAKFYLELAAKMERPWMRQAFEGFAKEEAGHKEKLLKVKRGQTQLFANQKVMDLKIGDYLVEVDPAQVGKTLEYQQALILAMKKEKAAFKLYSDLATATTDTVLQSVLLGLAQEEAKHKLRFEVEYDEQFLKEN